MWHQIRITQLGLRSFKVTHTAPRCRKKYARPNSGFPGHSQCDNEAWKLPAGLTMIRVSTLETDDPWVILSTPRVHPFTNITNCLFILRTLFSHSQHHVNSPAYSSVPQLYLHRKDFSSFEIRCRIAISLTWCG